MDSNNINGQYQGQYPNGVQPQYQQQQYQQPQYQQPVYNIYQTPWVPEELRPISMWGYFGYELLFAIPVIGFIALIVLAVGASNRNVKNFARSYFCLAIIILVFILIIALLGGGAIFFSGMKF